MGMAHTWMRAICEGYLAKQNMAHLSRNRWKYLGKKLHQQGSGLNETGSGLPLLLGFGLANVAKKLITKLAQKGSGLRRRRTRIR